MIQALLFLLISSPLLFACDGDESEETTPPAAADAGAPSADPDASPADVPDATPEPIETVTGTYRFDDYLSMAPLAGTQVTLVGAEGEPFEADADGRLELELPARSPFELKVTAEGYYSYNLFGETCGPDCTRFPEGAYRLGQPLVSLDAGDLLAEYVGIEQNDESGFVIAVTFCRAPDESFVPCPGVAIELDSDAEVVIYEDDSDSVGIIPGNNVTVSGGIIFGNAAAGPSVVRITPPAELNNCSVYPSDAPSTSAEITIYPREVSVIDFVCDRVP